MVTPEPQSVVPRWLEILVRRDGTSWRYSIDRQLGRGPETDGQVDRWPSGQEKAKGGRNNDFTLVLLPPRDARVRDPVRF